MSPAPTTLQTAESDPQQITGLTTAEATRLLAENGPNVVGEVSATPAWKVLVRQFTGFLVLLLIGACGVALVLGEHIDAIAIGMVVVLNGVLGFVQEWRAETSLAALRNMLVRKARVMRDGHLVEVDSREIVPGDMVLLDAGDQVPADSELTTALGLRVDESVLTGESVPVTKVRGGDGAEGMVMMGTSVTAGRAEARVTATGAATAFGRIATLTGSVGEKQTHLSRQLGRWGCNWGLQPWAWAWPLPPSACWSGATWWKW
jgi:Ca2+-transporting ATPase